MPLSVQRSCGIQEALFCGFSYPSSPIFCDVSRLEGGRVWHRWPIHGCHLFPALWLVVSLLTISIHLLTMLLWWGSRAALISMSRVQACLLIITLACCSQDLWQGLLKLLVLPSAHASLFKLRLCPSLHVRFNVLFIVLPTTSRKDGRRWLIIH